MRNPRNQTEAEQMLRSFGWKRFTEAQADKVEYLERKIKGVTGEHLALDRVDDVDSVEFEPDLIPEQWNRGKGSESLYVRNYEQIKWDD